MKREKFLLIPQIIKQSQSSQLLSKNFSFLFFWFLRKNDLLTSAGPKRLFSNFFQRAKEKGKERGDWKRGKKNRKRKEGQFQGTVKKRKEKKNIFEEEEEEKKMDFLGAGRKRSAAELGSMEEEPGMKDFMYITPLGAGNEVGRSCIFMEYRF